MFKFAFDIEDADDEIVVPQATEAPKPAAQLERAPAQPCHSISLADLIRTLPENFSYSPLAHPTGGRPLLRRDLYDARFQLARSGEEDAETEGTGNAEMTKESGVYVDADTDLIPGTYEGGLKSWEGGVDLVEVIARSVGGAGASKGKAVESDEDAKVAAWVNGARVLEVGCGTGLPSAYLLRALLSAPPSDGARTTIHLQDYNLPVLSLVTLPNLILAALPSLPLSARNAAESAPLEAEDDGEDDEDDERAPFDPTRAGILDLTPVLLNSFAELLEERGVELRFTYGDWGGMAAQLQGEKPYELVLTAETIYAEDSVAALTDVLRAVNRSRPADAPAPERSASLEDSLDALNVKDEWAQRPLAGSDSVILVAAKVLYFGVGGGLDSFLAHVTALKGWNSRVRDWVRGVGRAVVRVGW